MEDEDMGLKGIMNTVLGTDTEDDEIEITEEEIEEAKARLNKKEAPKPAAEQRNKDTGVKGNAQYEQIAPMISRGPQAKRMSMNGSGPFKMLVIEPANFDECTKLVDNLKSRKPVIINLERVETDLARKMFDFMSGATYALNGNVQKVTSNIFIFAPANVDIAAKVNRESNDAGYGDNRSPWR
ncbi:MAG: cell division protein SepF [Baileyella intestinalis]|jgi:cell division inhibitor SepF|uniref:Cell division protein SepF n=2 Tax=Baileyella intestinalis TaxID=2606709 RepID=A0A6A8M606_9FIRM|nr:cell division protein SepF [Baileyella intestinalis]MDD5874279.1 cell division protein SepF [Baileyella intestinalis]MST68008.1 cell division protein SepF [Baileyella intestinalis]